MKDLGNDTMREQLEAGLLDLYDGINDIIKENRLELQDRASGADAVGDGL
jgi:hypothetical protein